MQKILLDDVGLRYICATAERFFAVGRVLAAMVVSLAEQPSTRLLKHIIRCYLRLSDNPRSSSYYPSYSSSLSHFSFSRACEALKTCLPEMLRDGTFHQCLRVSSFIKSFAIAEQITDSLSTGGSDNPTVAAAAVD